MYVQLSTEFYIALHFKVLTALVMKSVIFRLESYIIGRKSRNASEEDIASMFRDKDKAKQENINKDIYYNV
jgi:hypothetical protein